MKLSLRKVSFMFFRYYLVFLTAWPLQAADGDLDSSFDGDGRLITDIASGNDFAYALGIQSDGKIIVAGHSSVSNDDIALVRYHSDGSLDTSFDGDGTVTTDIGSSSADFANALGIQSDGKIVVAGSTLNGGNYDIALVRYNSNGSLDTSFGGDGTVTTAIGASHDAALALGIQSDGKIVVAGYTFNGSNYDIVLVRYNNSDGSLDTSFDGDGKVTTAIGSDHDSAFALAIQSDGKIVVAGYSVTGGGFAIALARYNSDGSLDTSFDGDGKVITDLGPANDAANALRIQSDGKIVVAGYTLNGGDYDIALVRYNSDGSLDISFDGDGTVTTDLGSNFDKANALGIQSDGKIVVAGSIVSSGNEVFALVRYKSNGSLDTSFGGDGTVTTAIGADSDRATALGIQSDSNIVVAGISVTGGSNDFSLARYFSSIDTDQDGIADSNDNCPSIANADQLNTDADSEGDACDSDDDNDGYRDSVEIIEGSDPLDANSTPLDTDGDFDPNSTDPDDDNDGFSDSIESHVGSDSLDNLSIPQEINSNYFSIDQDESSGVIINNAENNKNVTYSIYNALGTLVNTTHVSINPKTGLNISLLDPNIVNNMSGQTEGNIKVYYFGNALDITANVVMTKAGVMRRSEFVHADSVSSDTLFGVWFIKNGGSGKVYLTNNSNNAVTVQVTYKNQNGNELLSSSISIDGNSTQTSEIPAGRKLGIVSVAIISGDNGDITGQIVITDEKLGNTSHNLIDASLQQSSEAAKGQSNMGYKTSPIFMKAEVNEKETKGYVVLGNTTSEARLAYTSLWTKESGKIKLSKKSIPAGGVIKQKIHGMTADKILGVQVYHEGTGVSVIGNVYVSSSAEPKIGTSYLLRDKSPSDLISEAKGYNREFDTRNNTKSRLIVQNLSDSTKNVMANIYDESGNLEGIKAIKVKKKKSKSVNIGKAINNQETLGHVEMSHDGVAGDIKGNVVMTNVNSGTEDVSAVLDQESQG